MPDLKRHRTAASLRGLRRTNTSRERLIGRTKGGLNSKLHVAADAMGRPMNMFLSSRHRSDYLGARALLLSLPSATVLIVNRGYDADWLRWALADQGIRACIPVRKGRRHTIAHAPTLYRERHRIEIMFGRLKDWRRVATRYDHCPDLFLSACALAATVLFWLQEMKSEPRVWCPTPVRTNFSLSHSQTLRLEEGSLILSWTAILWKSVSR